MKEAKEKIRARMIEEIREKNGDFDNIDDLVEEEY